MDESKIDKMQGRWTTDSLFEYFTARMDDADVRYSQRFQAQEKAIDKSDAASEKRFEAVNEFRNTLSDQTKTFMPRLEAETRTHANAEKIDALASRMDKMETQIQSQDTNKDDKRTEILQMVQLIVGLLTILAIIIGAALIVNK